jgi:hypothetical protein
MNQFLRAALIRGGLPREFVRVVGLVQHEAEIHLLEMIETDYPTGSWLAAVEYRNQHREKDGEDCYDDEELDQRERLLEGDWSGWVHVQNISLSLSLSKTRKKIEPPSVRCYSARQ